ncbi:methyl-coenzyme M reductase operon protein D [Methanobacterium sp. MZ-A1]|jgi:methyl-coenzyme M reductase subunit D|uniref:Methyl-coenzyme M reductase operon protein D n=1 Tax=Methanobacterium subterraneum TaxID=59277 RepID=A0A2H4VR36_9EURY|nr:MULTISPECIES: methyl-coenzyme M reductase operon protein D [Methanobacterium]MBW4258305.1 methyl-coenzyme M reductase operon protein D [Methanobacterium sp. YSL]PKL71906.1 MAG: methyl-coenzyme M reductase operon protein D [Methanobacteriales archaeon HGW-Methanobacteriales-2]AUB55616.1 methyl-coenzyme M reductase operon protein D [Methanobacterium subterraneum]AUB57401.1 methyl-coenzyme M reductase operon protein D [Methanobacterium sp. MZ-A1]AUB60522.1 methyl-coenzyme M reductase operon pr
MDIEIFPHRLLSADTTEKLLNDLEELDGVKRMVIQGQRLPQDEDNPDQRIITIMGEKVDLQVKTGRVLMEIEGEETIDDVKDICEDILPFGYNIHVGTFIRKQKTVTDDIKYGEYVKDLPDEMVGLTDQNAQLSERATIIKKKD